VIRPAPKNKNRDNYSISIHQTLGCQLQATSGSSGEKFSMGIYGEISENSCNSKIVLTPREKAFRGTNRRLAAINESYGELYGGFPVIWWFSS
jgi:hypothetical protein